MSGDKPKIKVGCKKYQKPDKVYEVSVSPVSCLNDLYHSYVVDLKFTSLTSAKDGC